MDNKIIPLGNSYKNQIYIKLDTDNYEMNKFYPILLTRDSESDYLHRLMGFRVTYQSHVSLDVLLLLLSSFSI